MNSRNIKILTSIVAVVILSMIAMQWYWVRTVIEINSERFDRTAQEAINSVSDKTDEIEAKVLLLDEIRDTLKAPMMFFGKNKSGSHTFVFGDTLSKFEKNIRIEKNIISEMRTSQNDSAGLHTKVIINTNGNSVIDKSAFSFQTSDSGNTRKIEIVRSVVDKFIYASKNLSIKDRLSKLNLDSLIRSELISRGLNTEYSFGVFDKKNDSIVIKNGEFSKKDLMSSKISARIFPSEIFENSYILTVNFPSKSGYVISSVAVLLLFSALIVITVALLFAGVIAALIKQQKISDLKNDLISNISHELKTPVATINLAAEALNVPTLSENSEARHKYLGIISAESLRLKEMVEKVLSSAALENGQLQLHYTNFNLNELLDYLCDQFREDFYQKSGSLTVHSADNVLFFSGDRMHLMNAFSNIIENALKYFTDKPVLEISLRKENKEIILEFRDHGPGIKKEHLRKIFDSFYRVRHGDIHSVRGHGIGLSYSKKVIELHGGKISAASKENYGTVFTIILKADA